MISRSGKLHLPWAIQRVVLLSASKAKVSMTQLTRKSNSSLREGRESLLPLGTGRRKVLIVSFLLFSGFLEDKKFLRVNLSRLRREKWKFISLLTFRSGSWLTLLSTMIASLKESSTAITIGMILLILKREDKLG